jgi:hypothetical protein
MTSAAITFDRLTYIDRLKQAGIDDSQARAHADALDSALRDSVATKADIEDVKHELRDVEQRLDTKIDNVEHRLEGKIHEVELSLKAHIADVKADVLKWVIGAIGFQTLVILGALKFLK